MYGNYFMLLKKQTSYWNSLHLIRVDRFRNTDGDCRFNHFPSERVRKFVLMAVLYGIAVIIYLRYTGGRIKRLPSLMIQMQTTKQQNSSTK